MPKRNLIWILAAVVVAAVVLWIAHSPPHYGVPANRKFDAVVRTFELIQKNYYRRADEGELGRGAVRGMAEALDAFSTYVSPEDISEFQRRVAGNYRGLGLRWEVVEGRVMVIGPLPESPAHRAGVQAGDRILAVNDTLVAGLTPQEVGELLDARVEGKVQLELLSPGRVEPHTVELARGEFPVEAVQGLYRDESGKWVRLIGRKTRIAYLRITEFVSDTDERLRQVLRRLDSPRGLVLDLRDNPGGLPDSAVRVANIFLSEGVIVTMVTGKGDIRKYVAHDDGTYRPELPIVVLVNARSASGAEIVAGAMKAHYRAVLVGTRTRGKGCVQSMFELPGGLGQINLTTKEFFLSRSRPITRRPGSDSWGIDPHRQITMPADFRRRWREFRRRVEVVPAPPRPATMPATAPATRPEERAEREIIDLDAQLAEALRLLARPREIRRILRDAEREDLASQKARRLTKERPGNP